MLPSGAFYRHAEAAIALAPAVELHLGAAVRDEPVQIAGGWLVETAQGSVRTRQIVDTRPPLRMHTRDALLWQSFLGHEIECASPVFDPSMVALMDFDAVSDNGIAFTYVLPMSPTRALVEHTVFGRRPLSPAALADAQAAAVVRVARGSPVLLLRKECGALPMGLGVSTARPVRGHCRAGLMHGAARASTGYAFQRIQRWATSAVASLRRDGFAIGHVPDGWHQRAMDRLFLEVLRDHPERAADLFLTMFRDADASRVIRFLSDRGTALDCAAIIATLPVGLSAAPFPAGGSAHHCRPDRMYWRTARCARHHVRAGTLRASPSTRLARLRARLRTADDGRSAAVVGGARDVSRRLSAHFRMAFLGRPRQRCTLVRRLVQGGTVLILPALRHGDELTKLSGMLVGPAAALTVAPFLSAAAVPWAGAVLICVGLTWRIAKHTSIELLAVGALACFAPPLLGFALFFCGMHSSRHILRTWTYAQLAERRQVAAAVVAPMLGIVCLCAIGWRVGGDMPIATKVMQLLFVGLASVTVPHMALVEPIRLAGWRDS